MTFKREPKKTVKVRLGKFQEDDPCPCLACMEAGVTEPSVFVPDGDGPDEFGLEVPYGRWLHGGELAAHLAKQRQFREALVRFGGMASVLVTQESEA